MRTPDPFTAPPKLATDGSHLAALLYHLARANHEEEPDAAADEERTRRVYSQVANRLSELIDDVREVWIDRDDKREFLTLNVSGSDGARHPARALSDGTLRFLALTVLELDPHATGLVCLEEPENGIHPERIPAMLRLLQDIITDVREPLGPDNPLRQVIVNTHSPAVVAQVPDDSLLLAELKETARGTERFKRLAFACLSDTWRSRAAETDVISRGKLLAYLSPVVPPAAQAAGTAPAELSKASGERRRVADREDLQMLLPFAQQD
ncbi:MAG: AAA family ATPase [Bryobacteraceae bacterium]|nr:AAA family ATPase [Bryobacteraceae bacterium]